MTRMFALGRRGLSAALLLLAVCPARAHMVAADWGGADLPVLAQGRVLVRYEAATLSIAGARWQAEGGGTDEPTVLDASHAEAGEEVAEGEGGDGPSGGRAEYGGHRGFVPSNPASLSLDERVSRIEGYLPHLATKADIANLRVEMSELRTNLQADIADLRLEVEEKLGQQFRNFLLIISVMLSALGGLQLLVVKYVLLPDGGETQRRQEPSA